MLKEVYSKIGLFLNILKNKHSHENHKYTCANIESFNIISTETWTCTDISV